MAASVDVDAVEAAHDAWLPVFFARTDHLDQCGPCLTGSYCQTGLQINAEEARLWKAYHDARYPTEGAAR